MCMYVIASLYRLCPESKYKINVLRIIASCHYMRTPADCLSGRGLNWLYKFCQSKLLYFILFSGMVVIGDSGTQFNVD